MELIHFQPIHCEEERILTVMTIMGGACATSISFFLSLSNQNPYNSIYSLMMKAVLWENAASSWPNRLRCEFSNCWSVSFQQRLFLTYSHYIQQMVNLLHFFHRPNHKLLQNVYGSSFWSENRSICWEQNSKWSSKGRIDVETEQER